MMPTVTIREVNQNTSAIIERVRRGERLLITRSGQPQAVLSPYQPEDSYEQMVADGRLLLPIDPTAEIQALPATIDIDAILDQERSDRVW